MSVLLMLESMEKIVEADIQPFLEIALVNSFILLEKSKCEFEKNFEKEY